MTPELHKAKAERIESSMQKLGDSDYEAIIEATMLAGSHWLNFACHRMKLTAEHVDVMHAEYLNGVLSCRCGHPTCCGRWMKSKPIAPVLSVATSTAGNR
jgi:hypothetical protein